MNSSVESVGRSAFQRRTRFSPAVVRDYETERTMLWRWSKQLDDAGSSELHRTEPMADDAAIWLFPDDARSWNATRDHDGTPTVRATQQDSWRLSRDVFTLPTRLFDLMPCQTMTTVNMELKNEWHARVYLPDLPERGRMEQRFIFLTISPSTSRQA